MDCAINRKKIILLQCEKKTKSMEHGVDFIIVLGHAQVKVKGQMMSSFKIISYQICRKKISFLYPSFVSGAQLMLLFVLGWMAACGGQGVGMDETDTENEIEAEQSLDEINQLPLLDLSMNGQGETILAVPKKRVGMFYLGWDTPAATAVRQLKQRGQTLFTLEQVLRSDNKARVSQILAEKNLLQAAASFHYSIEPRLGFYCLYRARPGEKGAYPDCPDIANVARAHAQQMVASGIDFIVIDGTNLDVFSPFSDAIQLRPFEVLLEEWSKLRRQGIATPEIAIWARLISPQANLHQRYLAAYNNPAFQSVIMKDRASGKKVFFRVDNQNSRADLERTIAQNGGKNNIMVIPMWGNMPASSYQRGVWSFMSPCTDGDKMTVSILNRSCQQRMTQRSPLGSQLAISLSYQLRYASEPFGSSGRLGGLTLRRQFERAFREQPDYLLLNGWNEFVAQPQNGPAVVPMGLEYEPRSDALYGRDWVDTFGEEFNRSFEPTKENGAYYLGLLQSCLRVFRSGAATCRDEREACCSQKQDFRNVYSLARADGLAHLWTGNGGERKSLVDSGRWKEVCAGLPTTTEFYCENGGGLSGPFLTFTDSGTHRLPLHRCYNGSFHLLSTNQCPGFRLESLLGYVSQRKNSTTPRSLRQCKRGSAGWFHVLSASCPSGTQDGGVLGFVK